jgi:hypothetical protein
MIKSKTLKRMLAFLLVLLLVVAWATQWVSAGVIGDDGDPCPSPCVGQVLEGFSPLSPPDSAPLFPNPHTPGQFEISTP